MPLLSEIEFCSFLCYAPQGKSELSEQSRLYAYGIKNYNLPRFVRVMDAFKREEYRAFFSRFLGDDVVLVPAPSSAILMKGALWVPDKICRHLVENGYGCLVAPFLKRITRVTASRLAPPHLRPKAQEHYDSMAVEPEGLPSRKMVVVDDVITRGATALACVSLLKSHFPEAEIHALALVRTMSGREVTRIVEPCIGKVTLRHGDCFRHP